MKTFGAVVALALLLGGCAQPAAPPAAGPPSVPPSVPPSGTPAAKPPTEPSDRIKDNGWVVGTVTAGGSGPCYGLITDDGTQYALYDPDGTRLDKGARVRVRTATAVVRIHCGPGKLVEMTAVEPVR